MKRLTRFKIGEEIFWGELDLASGEIFFVNGSVYEEWERGEFAAKLDAITLLPPCDPKNVVGLAFNYKDLVGFKDSYEEPLLFLKSTNTVVTSSQPIIIPKDSIKTWVEVEIAIVIKKPLFNASFEDAEKSILGITIANDVTTQNIANRDHHLALSKSQPNFCPIGDYITTDIDTSNLTMNTRINGVTTQESSSKHRILNEIESLVLISRYIPLFPGDVVLTGTPAGAMNSLVSPNDSVILTIEGLGKLSNRVVKGQ